MDNPRPEKVAVVDDVRERLRGADAAILTEYRGLKVKELAALRGSLRDVGGEYRIYKNTLVRFAARDLGLADLESLLEGPTAIAFVRGDAATVAKALRDYARTNPNLVVKGGVLGDKVLSATDTTALADLPPRDVLLARLAGGLAAPLQQMAGLLAALPRNFAYGLKALLDQGGADPAAASAPAAQPESAGSSAQPESAGPADALAAGETSEAAPTAEEVRDALPAEPTTDAATDAPPETETTAGGAGDAAADSPAEALASGDTTDPAPTADEVHDAVEAGGTTETQE